MNVDKIISNINNYWCYDYLLFDRFVDLLNIFFSAFKFCMQMVRE